MMRSSGPLAPFNTPQPRSLLYKLPNSAAFYQRELCFCPEAPPYEPMNLWVTSVGEITHLGSFNKPSLFLPQTFKT